MDKNASSKEYLISDRPAKALVTFALPMMVGNLFQQLYNMTDSVVVGRFVGENALAAVGASYSLTNVFISIAIGGGVGASVITAQAFGRRDYPRMRRSRGHRPHRLSGPQRDPGGRGAGFLPGYHGPAADSGEHHGGTP